MRHRDGGAGLTSSPLTAAAALAFDAEDALSGFAAEFLHPYDAQGRKLVYLAGHSLGLQPTAAAEYVRDELADWAKLGVLGHTRARRPWADYQERLAAPLARLVGADVREVVAMNSLTVNLHLMMVSFFRPTAARNCILIERSAFPSDRYAVASQLEVHGLSVREHLIELAPRTGERCLRTEDIVGAIDRNRERLALVLLPGVQYLTGQAFELGVIVAQARRAGARVGLDLAHAIGNIPLALHDWDADFAVWCSYKYLNGGPGALGGCFVHARHANDSSLPRFAGWWGMDREPRFEMRPEFVPSRGAPGWQLSNPPILAGAPLLASLDIFERAGLERLRRKSLALTQFMQQLLQSLLPDAVRLVTPDAAEERGCQLSLRIVHAPENTRRCHDRLIAAGVIGDWRAPDILRFAPTPLYTSFSDVYAAVDGLTRALRP